MTNVPQVMIREAENSAADYAVAKALAERGCPPKNWNPDHPCEFGVFCDRRNGYAVAPLFPHVIASMNRDGFKCVYRTDT